jgi:predicted NBD/HSP70 family sugar kinase
VAQSHNEVRVAVADFEGRLQGVSAHGLSLWGDQLPSGGTATLVNRWLQLLAYALEAQGFDWGDIAAMVVGVPQPRRQRPLHWSVPRSTAGPMAPAQSLAPATAEVGRQLALPVLVENDANLGALGEAIFGAGRGAPGIVYSKIVNDIGGGIVINGQIFSGAHGIAGELAHVPVGDGGPKCFCGSRGCLGAVQGYLFRRYLGIVYGERSVFPRLWTGPRAGTKDLNWPSRRSAD